MGDTLGEDGSLGLDFDFSFRFCFGLVPVDGPETDEAPLEDVDAAVSVLVVADVIPVTTDDGVADTDEVANDVDDVAIPLDSDGMVVIE